MILYKNLVEKMIGSQEQLAIEKGKIKITYGEFEYNVKKTIAYLQEMGIVQGNRVLVLSENRIEILYLCFAASFLGCTLVFLYDLLDSTEYELQSIIEDSCVQWLIFSKIYVKKIKSYNSITQSYLLLDDIHQRNAINMIDKKLILTLHSVYIQTYTSGTTGKPKGACLSEKSFHYQLVNIIHAMKLDAHSRVLLTGTLANTTGLLMSLATFFSGGCLIFQGVTEIFYEVEKNKITHFLTQAAELEKGMRDKWLFKRDLSSLKMVAYGAAPMPRKLIEEARHQLPCEWVQGYGLTETCGPITWLNESDYFYNANSVGKPSEYIDIKIIEDEIIVSGKLLMLGYWNAVTKKPDFISEFHTGDLGELKSGFLYLKGRKKDCVVRANGYTLYPKEIENIFDQYPDVYENVVVGIESDFGEIPVAVVRSNKKIDLVKIKRFIQLRLSSLKWPEFIFITQESFPINKSGKMNKDELRRQILEGHFNDHVIDL